MINRCFISLFLLFSLTANAQLLRDINYSYQYDPTNLFTFNWRVIKADNGYTILYDLQKADTTHQLDLKVEFETRESISQKSGVTIPYSARTIQFNPEQGHKLVVAKITVTTKGKPKEFLYHKSLPKNKSYYLTFNQTPVIQPYIRTGSSALLKGANPSQTLYAGYYGNPFPAAAPAFSSAQAKVAKVIKPDSIFVINPETVFTNKGLYLVQSDTASTEGFAFRVEEDYPKLGKLQSLVDPLIYVCTKQETDKLKQAGNDKKKFDQVILALTGNEERARNFMRSYFKRIELANQYFSSYKEGWKTDRGMIYVVFGIPDEVYLFEDREIWEYKNENQKHVSSSQNHLRYLILKTTCLFVRRNLPISGTRLLICGERPGFNPTLQVQWKKLT